MAKYLCGAGMKKAAIMLALASVVFGGAAGKVDQAKINQDNALAAVNAACRASRVAFKDGPLEGKLRTDGPISISMMANDARPTPEELPLIRDYAEQDDRCAELTMEFGRQYAAPIVKPVSDERLESSFAFADLLGGKITYGDFNRRIMKLTNQMSNAIEEANAAETKSKQSQAKAEEEEERAKWEALGQSLRDTGKSLNNSNPALPPPPAAPMTQGPMNCRTVLIGNMARTQCY